LGIDWNREQANELGEMGQLIGRFGMIFGGFWADFENRKEISKIGWKYKLNVLENTLPPYKYLGNGI